jgi:RNA polymerase sigma-70 factor (ECF subfamily)
MDPNIKAIMISDATASPQVPESDLSQAVAANWIGVVERIRSGDQSGVEELYGVFSRGIRYYLCRQLGSQDLDDRVHDCFLVVIQAIQNGSLREPERLMGFVRTIVRRGVAGFIGVMVETRKKQIDLEFGNIVPDRSPNPENTAISKQHGEIAVKVLKKLSSQHREILTRFYLHEQDPEQICREMKITETQFRLMKSRAKAKFGELGQRRLTRKQEASSMKVA